MGFSRPEYLPGDLPNLGIKPRSPALQADSLPVEPPWKHKNTGVSSLSLLQQVFPTQGLNPGLLHYRWILYCLGHQGIPRILEWISLSLLQGIFLTHESNRCLLHCRQILYQLGYQGSSTISISLLKLMFIESVMPSKYLILFCSLLLLPSIFPSIRVFSNESAFAIRWPKLLELQLQHQSFQ